MKKIALLLALTVGFLITSCSKSDSPTPTPTPDAIIGVWKLTSETKQNGSNPPVATVLTTCAKNSSYTFDASGTGLYAPYALSGTNCNAGTTQVFTWTNTGNNIYKYYSGTTLLNTATNIFSNNNTVFTSVVQDGSYTITSSYTKQ